ncbi:MAG: oligosaccharide flippase family protein [Chloroflexota bacterium]
MTEPDSPPDGSEVAQRTDADRQIRGSSLLLVGRLIAIGLDLVTQVLIVRSLSKGDFGAFAFALSIVSLLATISVFGLDKTLPRFAAIYEENRDRGRLVGSIALGVMTIAGLGVAGALVAMAIGAGMGPEFVETEGARELLLILVILGPIQAFDTLLIGLLAVFAGPRAIFLRRYILAPGLQLTVVIVMTLSNQSVQFLGAGYVAAGAFGVAVYGIWFVRLLRRLGHLRDVRRAFRLPVREVYGITIPFLSTDVVLTVRTTLVIILLQFVATSSDVADYRAVVPLARQNLIVLNVFSVLFIPAASRLFARGAHTDLDVLYWRMTHLIAVVTFPIFIVSFAFAEPIAVLFFGERYASSGSILAWLALGQYVSAALGFNALTLRVYAQARYTVAVDVITILASAIALIVLVSRFGALGGAVATCLTLVLQNTLYQVGLARGTGVRAMHVSGARVYGSIAIVTAVVFGSVQAVDPPLIVGLIFAGVASAVVLAANRDALRLAEAFPELLRIPFARYFIGASERSAGP